MDKKTGSGARATSKVKGIQINEKLAHELHKTIIKKFKRRKEYSRFKERVFRFKENIWAADLAEMESLSS